MKQNLSFLACMLLVYRLPLGRLPLSTVDSQEGGAAAAAAATYAPETTRRSPRATSNAGVSSSRSPNLLQRGTEDSASTGGLINRTDGALFESELHNNNNNNNESNNNQQQHQQVDNPLHAPVEPSLQKDIEGATELPSGALLCVENSQPAEALPVTTITTTTTEDRLHAPGTPKEICIVSPVTMPAVVTGSTEYMELAKVSSAIAPANEDISASRGPCEDTPRDGGGPSEAGVTIDEAVTSVTPSRAEVAGSPKCGDGVQRIPATNRSDHALLRSLEHQLLAEEREKQVGNYIQERAGCCRILTRGGGVPSVYCCICKDASIYRLYVSYIAIFNVLERLLGCAEETIYRLEG